MGLRGAYGGGRTYGRTDVRTDVWKFTPVSYSCPKRRKKNNKAGYTATLVTCGWAGAVLEVTRTSGQEPYAQ